MGALWVLSVTWGTIWTGMAAIAPRGYGFWCLIIGWAPAGLLAWFAISRSGKRDAAHRALLASAGVDASSGFDHSEGGTGIAINRVAKTVSLMAGGVSKTYPYADVRGWESSKERAGQVIGVGLAAGAAAMGANIRAEREAAANTGLFLTVRDIDHPKWRIEMRDAKAQARWMEILQQSINESA